MRGLALVSTWGGALVALLAAGQAWWVAGSSSVTGTSATSGAALVVVLAALAGWFLSRWLRTAARRVITVLVAALFAGGVAVALSASAPAALPGSALNDAAITATPWRFIYLGALTVAVAGAVLSLVTKPGGPRPAATPDPALDTWKALDAGDDPTEQAKRGAAGDTSPERQQ